MLELEELSVTEDQAAVAMCRQRHLASFSMRCLLISCGRMLMINKGIVICNILLGDHKSLFHSVLYTEYELYKSKIPIYHYNLSTCDIF